MSVGHCRSGKGAIASGIVASVTLTLRRSVERDAAMAADIVVARELKLLQDEVSAHPINGPVHLQTVRPLIWHRRGIGIARGPRWHRRHQVASLDT